MVGRHQFVSFSILALLFAGCLGGSPAQVSDSSGATGIVEPSSGVKIRSDLGALEGTVFDDKAFPVKGARVSLLGTDNFTDTGSDGRFLFVNLTPGTHQLSASVQYFQPYLADVEVKAGNMTRHDVQLLPVEDAGAGYRPHVHDYWLDKTERVIMDRDVDFREVQRGSEFGGPPYNLVVWGAAYPSINTTMSLDVPSTPEDPRLIYPGTRQVVVTLAWDTSKTTVHSVGLEYTMANGKGGKLGRQASPAVFKIPINLAEETDRGHQWFSLWDFRVYMGTVTTSGENQGTNTRPALLYGAFHATIKVIKGDLLPEPPHVDHWQGKTQKALLNITTANPRSSTDVVDRTVYQGPKLDSIVPPGTKTLRIFFVWEYDQLNQTAPAVPEQVLTWKTAADDPKLTRAEHYRTAPAKQSGPQWKLYEIELKPADCDAFYQSRSLWKFLPATKDFERDSRDYDPRPSKIRMQVTAIRDPDFDASLA